MAKPRYCLPPLFTAFENDTESIDAVGDWKTFNPKLAIDLKQRRLELRLITPVQRAGADKQHVIIQGQGEDVVPDFSGQQEEAACACRSYIGGHIGGSRRTR